MARADTHTHSKYSDAPSLWLLKKMGISESYTSIEDLYLKCKAAGMDFVTLTDHNTIRGALELKQLFPKDTFTGVEVTTRFPEDDTHIHFLVWGITARQFEEMDRIRGNIYHLRDYVRSQGLACSVAHATYAVNDKLSEEVFEKLILLFDVFEGINGARNPEFNHVWTRTLSGLRPADIERLYQKHRIEPFSKDPWIKGFTGGSDDHAGLYLGRTWTRLSARTPAEFCDQIREKKSTAGGRSHNFKAMAVTLSKIAHDFYKTRDTKKPARVWRIANRMIFDDKALRLRDRYILNQLRRGKPKERVFARFIEGLDMDLIQLRPVGTDERVQRIYDNLATLMDDMTAHAIRKSRRDLERGDVTRVIKNFTSAFRVFSMTVPFFATMKHLRQDQELVGEWEKRWSPPGRKDRKKVLWFTDTLTDLNGVSFTLQNMARHARTRGAPLKIVCALREDQARGLADVPLLNLPVIESVSSEIYDAYTMNLPSVLRSIDMIAAENPTEMVISTPGPVGLTGLLAARLLGIPCSGIYHSDFGRQIESITGDAMLSGLFESFTRMFYRQMDCVRAPSRTYVEELARRGLSAQKLKIFRRGIDTTVFRDISVRSVALRNSLKIGSGFTMLYAGRVSRDKDLADLVALYQRASGSIQDLQLLIAGDGPWMSELREMARPHPGIFLLGKVPREDLPGLYSLADVFVFPGTTDTFGMVVLEAQSCVLRAFVPDAGGPRDIIVPEKTGFVLPAHDTQAWTQKIFELSQIKRKSPRQYRALRFHCRKHIRSLYSRDRALADLLGMSVEELVPKVSPSFPKSYAFHG